MKKVMMLFVVCLFLGFNALNASADVLVTGGYSQQNNANQVMNVSKTQMQIGATDRSSCELYKRKIWRWSLTQ